MFEKRLPLTFNRSFGCPLLTGALLALSIVACGGDKTDGNGSEEEVPANIASHQTVRSAKPQKASTQSADDLKGFTAIQRDFNADIFHVLTASTLKGENAAISPLSIHTALSMTYAGALGATAESMAKALKLGTFADGSVHSFAGALSQTLSGRELAEINSDGAHLDPVHLRIVNAIWVQGGVDWKMPYLDTLAENYGAGLETLNFRTQPEDSRMFINNWVEDATNKRIKDLLPPNSITPDTASVLTNAIYFKAPWETPFVKQFTQAKDFTTLSGPPVKADYIQDTRMVLSANLENTSAFQAVQIPFRDGKLAMMFILPPKGDFENSVAAFDRVALDELVESLSFELIQLSFPKFEFESSASLKDSLMHMGMTVPFDDKADFTAMTEELDGLWIGDVFHKVFVAVDETGAEAAAATAVAMDTTSAMPTDPKHFVADRPFLFVIRDIPTDAILFFGQVVDPTVK